MQSTGFHLPPVVRPLLLLAGFLACGLMLASCGAEAPVFDVGSIEVTSTPSGAAIRLNGRDTGFTTPHTLANLDLDTHEIWVDHADFITVDNPATVDLQLKQNVALDFALTDTGLRLAGPAGAKILVDGEDTGRIVPAGVAVPDPGPVKVTLELDGYLVLPGELDVTVAAGSITEIPADAFIARAKKTVVLEGFSNVSCPPCPQLADNLLAMAAKPEFSSDRVQFIEFSVSWPELGDPFFQANPAENASRYTLYGVSGAPDIYVDGIAQANALDAAAMEAAVLSALESEPGFLIDVAADFAETSVPVTVTLTPYQDQDFTDCVLFVAIYRKEIILDPAPGLNGQTHFHHVFLDRADVAPELPALLPAGAQEQYQLTLSNRYPAPDTFVALAFVQHLPDLTILQTGSSEVEPPAPERISR